MLRFSSWSRARLARALIAFVVAGSLAGAGSVPAGAQEAAPTPDATVSGTYEFEFVTIGAPEYQVPRQQIEGAFYFRLMGLTYGTGLATLASGEEVVVGVFLLCVVFCLGAVTIGEVQGMPPLTVGLVGESPEAAGLAFGLNDADEPYLAGWSVRRLSP